MWRGSASEPTPICLPFYNQKYLALRDLAPPPVPRPSFTHQCARFARASTGSALPMHTLCFVTTHFVLWFCSPPPPVRKQAPRPRNDARSFRESERWWRIWGDAAGARTFAVPIGTTHSRSKGLWCWSLLGAGAQARMCVWLCVAWLAPLALSERGPQANAHLHSIRNRAPHSPPNQGESGE